MNKSENTSNIKSKMKYIYIISILGIILDQIVKFVVRLNFNSTSCTKCLSEMVLTGGKIGIFRVIPEKGIEIIPNFFYIINVKNTGGAWGIFSNNAFFLALISIFVIGMLYLFLKSEKNMNKLSITYYGFLFGGIIGNLIDRIFNGYVTDYLNFYIFGYDYPVFNIADILIVVGILLMAIDVVRGEIHAHYKRKGRN